MQSNLTRKPAMKASPEVVRPSKLTKYPIEKLHPQDVLFGRGGHANSHEGNKAYNSHIETRAWEYSRLKGRNAKTKFAWDIVHQMKKGGARFLHRNKQLSAFYEASDEEARRKVSQRLRELAKHIREHEESEDDEQESMEELNQEDPDQEGEANIRPLPIERLRSDEDAVLVENKGYLTSCLLGEDANKGDQLESYPYGSVWSGSVHKEVTPSCHQPESLCTDNFQGDISFSPCDWDSERAVCGSVGDLSDCGLVTSIPMSFGVVAIDWPQHVALNHIGSEQEKISSPVVPQDLPFVGRVAKRGSLDYMPQHNSWQAGTEDFQTSWEGRATKRRRTFPNDEASFANSYYG